ncbi:hypothetical protein D3C86_1558140 [compost metagenome]
MVFCVLYQVRKTVTFRIQVRGINLVNISGKNDLGIFSCSRNDGLDLMRGQVLGFIYNKENLAQCPSPDIGQRRDHYLFCSHKLFNPCLHFRVFIKLLLYKPQVVPYWRHIRINLRFYITRQKTNVLIA